MVSVFSVDAKNKNENFVWEGTTTPLSCCYGFARVRPFFKFSLYQIKSIQVSPCVWGGGSVNEGEKKKKKKFHLKLIYFLLSEKSSLHSSLGRPPHPLFSKSVPLVIYFFIFLSTLQLRRIKVFSAVQNLSFFFFLLLLRFPLG
ncbi:hypothetical protein HMI54_002726 [Coelomomyces lativittatus]|nr:hypothetical protein HMI56_005446 [Coelomomyces lativittatus]KAJ1518081.1 hypothetical protein HMI54_002726 [Coelomomyces lativittatus]